VAAEPLPTVARLRPQKTAGIAIAPQFVAEALLHVDAFSEVRYVGVELGRRPAAIYQGLAPGTTDISMAFEPPLVLHIDAGAEIILLRSVHVSSDETQGDQILASQRVYGAVEALVEAEMVGELDSRDFYGRYWRPTLSACKKPLIINTSDLSAAKHVRLFHSREHC
jgi:hypothetical protein